MATASLKSLKASAFPPLAVLPHVKVKLREQRIYLQSAALCRWIATANTDGVFTLEDAQPNGWFATEDAAEKVAGGLKILGRRDEIVKILGTLVPVQEIEQRAREFFMGLEGDLCILTIKSARAENRLVLVTDTVSSLREWEKRLLRFNSKLEGPSRLSGLVWVSEIPLVPLGKIRKPALRQSLFPGV